MVKDLPKTCCMNVAYPDPGFKACDKPATHWYQHNEDICSYCDDHDYQCGAPIHGAAEAASHCLHEHQDVNDRNLVYCLICNEELGR